MQSPRRPLIACLLALSTVAMTALAHAQAAKYPA